MYVREYGELLAQAAAGTSLNGTSLNGTSLNGTERDLLRDLLRGSPEVVHLQPTGSRAVPPRPPSPPRPPGHRARTVTKRGIVVEAAIIVCMRVRVSGLSCTQ
jgi:hypothetical protein